MSANHFIILITVTITMLNTGFALQCIDCPNTHTMTSQQDRVVTSIVCPAGSTTVLDRLTVLSDNLIIVQLRKTTSPQPFSGPSILPVGQTPTNYVEAFAIGFGDAGNQMSLMIGCVSTSCTVQYGYSFSCKTLTGPNWWYDTWGDQCFTLCYQQRTVVCKDQTGLNLPDSACINAGAGLKPPTEFVCLSGNCILDANAFKWVPNVAPGAQHPGMCGVDCILHTPYDCIDHNGLVTLPSYCIMVTPAPTMSTSCGSCDASVLRWLPDSEWSTCDSSCMMYRNASCHNAAFAVNSQLCISANIPTIATSQSCSGGCCIPPAPSTPAISMEVASVIASVCGLLAGAMIMLVVVKCYSMKKVGKSGHTDEEQPYLAMAAERE